MTRTLIRFAGYDPTEGVRQFPGPRLDFACRRGHERTDENVYVRPDGHRCCRKCRAISWHNRRNRERQTNA